MTIDAFVFDAYGTLYDVQSVSDVTEGAFPGKGALITQVWRLKQLEYTWLRSLMPSYLSFWDLSKDALVYTLNATGLEARPEMVEGIMAKYLDLEPYPDAVDALEALKGRPLAILSNGNQSMLDELVRRSGLNQHIAHAISTETVETYKPHPAAYQLVEHRLGIAAEKIMFVSSNAFDATAAKAFGFQVSWIERVTPDALAREIEGSETVAPETMFKILRMQTENFGELPDHRLRSLRDLAALTD